MTQQFPIEKGHIRTFAAATMAMFLLVGSDCKSNGGMITPNPPVITDQNECVAACANLQKLHCPEGNAIDMRSACKVDSDCKGLDGQTDTKQACTAGKCMTSCANFCIETENQGVWLDPICVKSITSCSQIDSCPLPKKPVPTCVGPACDFPGNK